MKNNIIAVHAWQQLLVATLPIGRQIWMWVTARAELIQKPVLVFPPYLNIPQSH